MSTVKTNALQAVAGGALAAIADLVNGTARAWINFNGTGTPAIRASYNVSSITDNGVGDYTINFTTALPDANYTMAGSCSTSSVLHGPTLHAAAISSAPTLMTTTQCRVYVVSPVTVNDHHTCTLTFNR